MKDDFILKYKKYIKEHIFNVKKGYNLLKNDLSLLFDKDVLQ